MGLRRIPWQIRSVRVLVAAESFLPAVNGVTHTVERTLDHLALRGHDVLLVAPGPGAPRQYAGFPVIEVPSFPWMGMRVGWPSRLMKLAIEGFKPDVLHAAAPFSLGYQALWAADTRGIPTVAVFQTDLAGFARRNRLGFVSGPSLKWLAAVHSHADVNLAPSSPAVADMKNLMNVKDAMVWPHGVDSQRFTPALRNTPMGEQMRRAFSPSGKPVVGYVGRLAPEKEVERLAACADLGCEIVVVGDGIARSKIEKALPSAHFTGRLSGEELAAAYSCLDVFVHTGRFETFGLTILEAMAAGVAVVAPAEGGPVDQVVVGETGYLYDPDQPRQMYEQVARLVKDVQLREEMGRAGRAVAETRSWAAVNDLLIDHFELAIERRGSTQRRRSLLRLAA